MDWAKLAPYLIIGVVVLAVVAASRGTGPTVVQPQRITPPPEAFSAVAGLVQTREQSRLTYARAQLEAQTQTRLAEIEAQTELAKAQLAAAEQQRARDEAAAERERERQAAERERQRQEAEAERQRQEAQAERERQKREAELKTAAEIQRQQSETAFEVLKWLGSIVLGFLGLSDEEIYAKATAANRPNMSSGQLYKAMAYRRYPYGGDYGIRY